MMSGEDDDEVVSVGSGVEEEEEEEYSSFFRVCRLDFRCFGTIKIIGPSSRTGFEGHSSIIM